MNSNNSKMISYDIITQNVIILTNEEKEIFNKKVVEELNFAVANYFTQKLSEQETFLFNFPESDQFSKDKSLFYTTIHKFISDIKKSNIFPFIKSQIIKIKITNDGEYKINYEDICSFVNFIIEIIHEIPKKKREKMVYDFSFNSVLPPNIKVEINGQKLSKIIENASFVKKITFCLSNEKSKNILEIKDKCNIDINIIQLFSLFFKAFFANLLYVSIDLNIYEINQYFDKEANTYKIKEEEILKFGGYYERLFLANLILIKKITNLSRISFTMFDSYQLEIHHIMSVYFSRNLNEDNERKSSFSLSSSRNSIVKKDNIKYSKDFINELLFLQHLIPAVNMEFMEVIINFNSLDPLLFSYINIILTRHTKLANISLKFFEFNKVSNRKILINSYFYNYYNGGKKNPLLKIFDPEKGNNTIDKTFDNNYKIYYDNLYNLSESENKEYFLLKDEAILNELFPYFNFNLNSLLTVLEDKIKEDKNFMNSLYLDFRSSNLGSTKLSKYNNYNTAIICFLYNFFNILEKYKDTCNLSSLDIMTDDFTDEKEFIISNIKHKIAFYKNKNSLKLNEIRVNRLNLNISNISLILPFKYFPMINIKELILENLSYNDLDDYINSLKKDKNLFNKVVKLKIGLNYMVEDFQPNIKILLKDCIFKKISNFALTIPNYISFDYICDILSCIKNNQNFKANYYLKLSNNKLSPAIYNTYFNNEVNNFKKEYKNVFHKRNIITDFSCIEYKKFSLSLKMLKNEDLNYYLKIIYCFNKIYNKKGKKRNINIKNRNIFENIFYYIGKYRDRNKNITIEII